MSDEPEFEVPDFVPDDLAPSNYASLAVLRLAEDEEGRAVIGHLRYEGPWPPPGELVYEGVRYVLVKYSDRHLENSVFAPVAPGALYVVASNVMKPTPLPDLHELAVDIHRTAIDHGWWEEERDFDEMCFLLTTELSEAFEEYRERKPMIYHGPAKPREDGREGTIRKPEGFAVEMADVVIRACDTVLSVINQIGADVSINEVIRPYWVREAALTQPKLLGKAMRYIDRRINRLADLYEMGSLQEVVVQLTSVIVFVAVLAEREGCKDFWAVVREKMAYNDSRAYRHGGKVC